MSECWGRRTRIVLTLSPTTWQCDTREGQLCLISWGLFLEEPVFPARHWITSAGVRFTVLESCFIEQHRDSNYLTDTFHISVLPRPDVSMSSCEEREPGTDNMYCVLIQQKHRLLHLKSHLRAENINDKSPLWQYSKYNTSSSSKLMKGCIQFYIKKVQLYSFMNTPQWRNLKCSGGKKTKQNQGPHPDVEPIKIQYFMLNGQRDILL